MQVAAAALARGVPQRRANEAGCSASAQAQNGMNSISEAEKTFTSQVSTLLALNNAVAHVRKVSVLLCRCCPCY